MAQVSAALSIFDQIFFMNFSQPQGSRIIVQPVLFLIFSTCKTEGTLAKENPTPIFYLYAIYSFIYWPFYIQFLNVTCEPRLNSLLRFRTVFRSCPLFY